MRSIRGKGVLLMGLVAVIASLLGCAEPTDYSAIQTDLRARLELIQGAEVVKVEWARSGVSQSVIVELQTKTDEAGGPEAAARAAMDAIAGAAVAAGNSDNGMIRLWIRGADGRVVLKADEVGLPSSLSKLLESR